MTAPGTDPAHEDGRPAPAHSPATRVVSAGRPVHGPDVAVNAPIVLTSTFHAGGPVGYGRYGNPTWTALEDAVGSLEDGRALAFSSGMAAVSAVLDLVPVDGVVVAPESSYSGTLGQLRRLQGSGRLRVRLVDTADTAAVADAVRDAALLWVESPTNPLLGVADVPAVVAAGHAAGARVAVDSTFLTPLLQRPLEHGADVVVHSATKSLSGHSDVLLGIAVTRDEALLDELALARGLGGGVPGPVEAWLALRGLRTLHVRLERAQANALTLAQRLTGHPAVTRVRYPGLPDDPGHALATAQWDGYGTVVSIEVAGGADAADRACASTSLWTHATSLGGVESMLERRRRWAAESPAVPEDLIRCSVGIEDLEDLWRDLDRALLAGRGRGGDASLRCPAAPTSPIGS